MSLKALPIVLLLCVAFIACKKPETAPVPQGKCGDPDALNYDPSGTDNSVCDYAKSHLGRNFGYKVARYDLQPSYVGEVEAVQISNDVWTGFDERKDVTLLSFMSLFQPDAYPLRMHGYNFTITDQDSLYYAGARITGSGSFSGTAFLFKGFIHPSNGSSWAVEFAKE